MWVNPDVNMPQTLITAQREGSLVVFAGAGVSMGNPSNLPGYDELADAIAAGSVTRQSREPSDRFLGRAEQQGVDVQGSCRQRLQPDGSEPTPLHRFNPQVVRLAHRHAGGYYKFRPAFRDGAGTGSSSR